MLNTARTVMPFSRVAQSAYPGVCTGFAPVEIHKPLEEVTKATVRVKTLFVWGLLLSNTTTT